MQEVARRTRPWTRRPIAKVFGAFVAAGLLTAGVANLAPGGAGADITQPVNGEVVRDGTITIKENRGGIMTYSSTTSTMPTGECTGTNSPYSRIEVRDSANTLVFTADSPKLPRLFGLTYFAGGPWETTFDISVQPPGLYTITTVVRDTNKHRISAFNQPCQPKPEALLPTVTFEYRPWQHTFNDRFGGGAVAMNIDPAEFNATVDGQRTPILDGSTAMSFYTSPLSLLTSLPTDPSGCADDPMSCVPAGALDCDPGAGCEPNFVVINHNSPTSTLIGVFDLDTGIFAAYAKVNGNTRVLLSLGDDIEAILDDVLGDLVAYSGSLDLLSLLATEVEARVANSDGTSTVLTLSLLEGLALTENGTGPTGASLRAAYGLAAGAAIIHTYTYALPFSECGKYTGYEVAESQLIPTLSLAGAPASVTGIAALLGVGGPVKRVTGTWPQGAGNHVVSPLTVDTEAGEPNGLPVWLPAVSGTGPAVPDGEIDFVGVGTVLTTPESCTPPIPILLPNGLTFGFGFLLGTGVALFDNPLPIGLNDIPLLFDEQSPEVQSLMAQISAAIDEITAGVLGNPDVQAVLDDILAAVPLADVLGTL